MKLAAAEIGAIAATVRTAIEQQAAAARDASDSGTVQQAHPNGASQAASGAGSSAGASLPQALVLAAQVSQLEAQANALLASAAAT